METLRNKSLGFYLKVGGLLILVITILNFIMNYGLVSITAQSKDSSDVFIEVFNQKKQKVEGFDIKPGDSRTFLLPKNSYELQANQGRSQSLTTFEVKILQKSNVVATLLPEKEVEKSGSESMGCGSTAEGSYFSYKCDGQSILFKHSRLALTQFSEKIPVDAALRFDNIKAYDEGFLAVSYGDDEYEIRYIKASNSQSTIISQPKQKLLSPILFTNNNPTPGSYAFGLFDSQQQRIALYRSLTDNSPVYMDFISHPSISEKNLTMSTPQINGGNVFTYFHPELRQGDIGVENEEAAADSDTPGRLLEYSPQKGKIIKEFSVPAKSQVFNVYKVGDTYLSENSSGNITVFEEKQSSLEPRGEFTDSDNIVVVKDIAYFNKSNAIYSYDPKKQTAYRIFSSSSLNISRLDSVNNRLFFTAFSTNTPSATLPEAYEINLTKNAAYPRSEELFPYDDSSINRMDYNESLILVSLSLNTLGWDRQTGQAFYDQAEFDRKKQEVTKKIKADGLEKGRSINFIY